MSNRRPDPQAARLSDDAVGWYSWRQLNRRGLALDRNSLASAAAHREHDGGLDNRSGPQNEQSGRVTTRIVPEEPHDPGTEKPPKFPMALMAAIDAGASLLDMLLKEKAQNGGEKLKLPMTARLNPAILAVGSVTKAAAASPTPATRSGNAV